MNESRLIPWRTLAGALALYLALNLLIVFVVFPSGLLRVLSGPSGGLISSTLFANVLMLAALASFLRATTELTVANLGLHASGFCAGVAVTLALWLAVNAFEVACVAVADGSATLEPGWLTTAGRTGLIGALAGQLFGNAALEEILFRGLLFQQIRMHLLARHRSSPTAALVPAVIFSQLIFAAIHVPLRVSSGMALAALPAELALLFVLGALLALLYWRTGNLYVAIGVHALSNAPTLVVHPQFDVSTNGVIAAVGSVLVITLWPRARRDSPS